MLDAFTDSESRHASRLSGVLDPGYALLRDDRDFLAGLAAWRETILPESGGEWPTGQGYFGAQVVDRGVWQSIENDYLPVLFVRETGALGLLAIALLVLVGALGMWLLAGERFAHGSVSHRGRALAAAVLGTLCVYQPLASLGVLPLTGISWPGLGLDSPTDFWLLFGLASWIVLLRRRDRRRRDRAATPTPACAPAPASCAPAASPSPPPRWWRSPASR